MSHHHVATRSAPVGDDSVRDDGWMLWLAERLGVPRSALWIARLEMEALCVRAGNVLLPRRRVRLRALRSARDLLINVASGPFVLDGFVNLELRRYHADVVRWDCRRSLPLAHGSCRGIRIEHFAEHLDPRDELPRLLTACHRALAPGGVLRVVVPDTRRFLQAYVNADRQALDALAVPDPLPDDLPTPLDVVNHVFHQWHEHRWAYDLDSLRWRLHAAHFATVTRASYRSSQLPALAVDRAEHAPYSLYIEAVKSSAAAR